MPLNWMDISHVSFNSLLLLERVQIDWFPLFNIPQAEFATALRANPAVDWFLRYKNPQIIPWLDELLRNNPQDLPDLRKAELAVIGVFVDLLVYALDPSIYDAQPFLEWDSKELTDLVDFSGKIVLDIGSGTGRLAFIAAPLAQTVFAVEPVANLRDYMRRKAASLGYKNFYAVDGLLTEIPFPDGFADVVMGGHVFGDDPEKEFGEACRVTRPGGVVIFCPGGNDFDSVSHDFLVSKGFSWGRFEEPRDGWKRKYWLQV